MLVTSNFLHFTIFFIFVVLYTVFDNVVCFSDNCLWELHYTKILPLKWVLWFLFFYFFGCYVGLNFQLYRIFFFFKFFQLLFYSQRVINLSLSFSLSVSVSLVVPEFFSKFMSWSTPPSFHPTKKFCIFSPHKFEIFPVSFHPNTWDFREVLFHFTTNLRFLSSFVSSGLKFIQ